MRYGDRRLDGFDTSRRRRLGRRVAFAMIAVALVVWFVPLPASFVEHRYSSRAYLALERLVAPIANAVPFALLDVLLLIVLGSLLVRLAIHRRRSRGVRRGEYSVPRRRRWSWIARIALDLAAVAALLVIWFTVTWGLNYRREPLRERLDYDRARITREAALAMTWTAVREMNRLHPIAHGAPWPSLDAVPPTIAAAFAHVQRLLGQPSTAIGGRPKWTLLQPYFRWAAIDGVTDPFFLETLVNRDILPIERPFVIAHEWSHLAGYAHESEANFLGWLIAQHAGPQAQYSGWIALYWHLAAALPAADRRTLDAALADGPRRDLRAIVERYEQSQPRIRVMAWSVYDRFLKANRVTEGVASYDVVVSLVLGTRFEPNWTPAGKPASGSPTRPSGSSRTRWLPAAD